MYYILLTCRMFHTWASGLDDRGNLIPRIDVKRLIESQTQKQI